MHSKETILDSNYSMIEEFIDVAGDKSTSKKTRIHYAEAARALIESFRRDVILQEDPKVAQPLHKYSKKLFKIEIELGLRDAYPEEFIDIKKLKKTKKNI